MDKSSSILSDPIKVFVITLAGAKERQENITSQLTARGVPFEFVFGVDGRKLSEEEVSAYYNDKKRKNYYHFWRGKKTIDSMTRGEIGCALSHRLAYSRIVTKNIQRAVIVEDDVILNSDFASVMNLFNKLPINKYVIKLEKEPRKWVFLPFHKIRLADDYFILHPSHAGWQSQVYYIDIKAALNMLKSTKRIYVNADDFEYFKTFVRLRVLNQAIVHSSGAFDSVIGDRSKSTNIVREFNLGYRMNIIPRKILKLYQVIFL